MALLSSPIAPADLSDRCDEDEVCWICLGSSTDDEPRQQQSSKLERLCLCPTRLAHALCWAKWCLHQAGKREEKNCRFCQAELPDYREALSRGRKRPRSSSKSQECATPTAAAGEWSSAGATTAAEAAAAALPLISVHFGNQVHVVRVQPGQAGKIQFERDVRELLGLPETQAFEVNFECIYPEPDGAASNLQLKGMATYDAAVFCASIAAAQRRGGGQQRSGSGSGATAPPARGGGGRRLGNSPASEGALMGADASTGTSAAGVPGAAAVGVSSGRAEAGRPTSAFTRQRSDGSVARSGGPIAIAAAETAAATHLATDSLQMQRIEAASELVTAVRLDMSRGARSELAPVAARPTASTTEDVPAPMTGGVSPIGRSGSRSSIVTYAGRLGSRSGFNGRAGSASATADDMAMRDRAVSLPAMARCGSLGVSPRMLSTSHPFDGQPAGHSSRWQPEPGAQWPPAGTAGTARGGSRGCPGSIGGFVPHPRAGSRRRMRLDARRASEQDVWTAEQLLQMVDPLATETFFSCNEEEGNATGAHQGSGGDSSAGGRLWVRGASAQRGGSMLRGSGDVSRLSTVEGGGKRARLASCADGGRPGSGSGL